MRAPLSDSSSSEDSSAGVGAGVAGVGTGVGSAVGGAVGAGVIVTTVVTDVTVAASGTISLTVTTRPDAASFSTKAVVKAAAKADDDVGSASVSWTAVASASDVVTSSYSTLSFGACSLLTSSTCNLRANLIPVIVTFDLSTPKPVAI